MSARPGDDVLICCRVSVAAVCRQREQTKLARPRNDPLKDPKYKQNKQNNIRPDHSSPRLLKLLCLQQICIFAAFSRKTLSCL